MKRDLLCRRCPNKIGEIEAKKTQIPKVSNKLCPICKEESLKKHREILQKRNTSQELRNKNSDRMKNSNPMFNIEVQKKVSKTAKGQYSRGERVSFFSDPEKLKEIKSKWKITDAGRKRISDRMKKNNPMFNEESKAKGVNTFREKVASGDIIYKRGKEHHLWKGNRSFADTLRVQLFPVWTKKCMERDGFTCISCGTNRNLTVHHLKPLRFFIKESLAKYNIKTFANIDSNDWQPYLDEIVAKHNLEDGITLCKQCHSDVDKHFILKGDKHVGQNRGNDRPKP